MNIKTYLKSIGKTFEIFGDQRFREDEAERIGSSDHIWASRKLLPFKRYDNLHRGDIYQFDFGKNLDPEMSYEHRGLIIGIDSQLLHVLPIFSYRPKKHKDLYDAINNPKGALYLLCVAKYGFIKHDSVMKLNDLRTVSTKRLLYQQRDGHIDINANEYKEIESLVLAKYFPQAYYQLYVSTPRNMTGTAYKE